MKYKLIFMAMAMMLYAISGYAQTPAIATAQPNVWVFPSSNPQSEVSISINKVNPANIIISTNTNAVPGTGGNQGFYFSTDGGATWSGSDNLQNIAVNGVLGDPATCFNSVGDGFLSTINISDNGYQMESTTNGGSTWSNPVTAVSASLGEEFDKEMITDIDDVPSSPYADNLYAAWIDFSTMSTMFNRSTDGGATFSTPIALQTGGFGTGTDLQTGGDGEVYVCWVNRSTGGSGVSPKAQSISLAYSADGGATFPSAQIHNPAFNDVGIDVDLRIDATSNFANTSVPFFPSMALDRSCGQYRGRVYIAYMEQENSTSSRAVIRVRSSDDHGATWSTDVTVTPSTVAGVTVQQNWFPWIAVDDMTGLVNVAYYCMDQATGNSTNTYVAYSTDGGATWQNIKVSDAAHLHGPIDNSMFRAGYCGDYIGITSFGGKSYVSWHDNRPTTMGATTGNWNVYVGEVDYTAQQIISSQNDLVINSPTPLPANVLYQSVNTIEVSTTNGVECAAGSHVEMKAGGSITIDPNAFVADQGSVFLAHITPVSGCTSPFISYKTGTAYNSPPVSPPSVPTPSNLGCYPNPTQGYITVVCSADSKTNATFVIRDMDGKLVYTISTDVGADNNYRFVYDGTDLSEGIYFYSVSTKDFTKSGKFVKD